MVYAKDNKNIMPLKCCQSNNSLKSISCDDSSPAKSQTIDDQTLQDERLYPKMIYPNGQDEKKIHIPKKQTIDIEFNDIEFHASSWSFQEFRFVKKQILHGLSGVFKSGNLSVVMGPSGSGKSTLINILAGFITRGSSGQVRYNDVVQEDDPRLRKLSAYIPQQEELRCDLTVLEATTYAAELKLGSSFSRASKRQQVFDVLDLLRLDTCYNTITSQLSGGERKRLAIALEVLSNPPILFLDEPTTGLDSLSCTQTVTLLKKLAQGGRTIICTIHQPSALLFETFDKLYMLSSGQCIYDGSIQKLVPHLSNLGLHCPPYHNPADFIIEVAVGEHGANINTLSRATLNMKLEALKRTNEEKQSEEFKERKRSLMSPYLDEIIPVSASPIKQFFLLYKRKLLENRRCYVYFWMRLLAHLVLGFMFGYLYRGVGSKPTTVLANYIYLFGGFLLVAYTGKMAVTLTFPFEMKVLATEHFNRWYKLCPYLLSLILIEIPFQILCSLIFTSISYYLTEQPMDFRIYLFSLYMVLGTICAQAWGYLIGVLIPMQPAVFIGPTLICVFSMFGFGMSYLSTPFQLRWLYQLSYYRAGFHEVLYSLYGFQRQFLVCPEDTEYCHYTSPNKFLKDMNVNHNLIANISLMVGSCFVLYGLTYFFVWLKLTRR